MIQLPGLDFESAFNWASDPIEHTILNQMHSQPVVYSYQSIDGLQFELKLRKNIIRSAKALNESEAKFETFKNSRCNPDFWHRTNVGGFRLRQDVSPADGILDIYKNSSLYGFECATAILIIYYHAVLESIGERLFNQYFQQLYLYSWHHDTDLGIQRIQTEYILPGDVVYFNNPDFHPETDWWRGENAVVLEDGMYFGHGMGITTGERIIQSLNQQRRPGGTRSAYLMRSATRPSFGHLARITSLSRSFAPYKVHYPVVHHDRTSLSYTGYLSFLNGVYYS
ncbi:protein-glutamine gamma-glutamyltransferase [Virgibacillus xinjiangensis]|uniref:Protein-glutamine gamma-glutamyltransferase n=1 Tax=Virgibacillus xinjiangensis TaxID=393090 RepID=A0ABV7CQZ5_9BACI